MSLTLGNTVYLGVWKYVRVKNQDNTTYSQKVQEKNADIRKTNVAKYQHLISLSERYTGVCCAINFSTDLKKCSSEEA